MSRLTAARSSTRKTTDSPNWVGRVETRMSMVRPAICMADAAVLRQTPLGNIQGGHDFQAGNDREGEVFGRRGHFVKGAVHAVADFEFVLERLEMDVAGAVLDGLKENEVDETDDGGLVGEVFQVGGGAGGGGFGGFAGDFVVLAQFLEDVGDVGLGVAIVTADGPFDFGGIGHDRDDFLADDVGEFIDHGRVERVGQGQLHGGVKDGHRQTFVHAGGFGGDGGKDFRGQVAVCSVR